MNNNDLVSRFREKTEKHWHPFMGVETKLEKRDKMSDDIVTRLRALISDLRKTVPQTVMIEAADEIERLRNALEQCIFERDTWRNLYDKERGGADYIGDDRYLHEPVGEVPKGKTKRL